MHPFVDQEWTTSGSENGILHLIFNNLLLSILCRCSNVAQRNVLYCMFSLMLQWWLFSSGGVQNISQNDSTNIRNVNSKALARWTLPRGTCFIPGNVFSCACSLERKAKRLWQSVYNNQSSTSVWRWQDMQRFPLWREQVTAGCVMWTRGIFNT